MNINKSFFVIIIIIIFCSNIFSKNIDKSDIPTPDIIKNDASYVFKSENSNFFDGEFKDYIYKNTLISYDDFLKIENKLIEKINNNSIGPRITKINDLFSIIGKPTLIIIRKKMDTMSLSYNYYYGTIRIFSFNNDIINEIRIEDIDTNYFYKEKLKIGSKYQEIIDLLGKPKNIIINEGINWYDEVLYLNEDKYNKFSYSGYICYNKNGIRFFINKNRISSIYLFDKLPNSE
jgi:hypothetical protein